MWNVNAVEGTGREERKTGGRRWPLVSVSAPMRRGRLQEQHVGLRFCGMQDAARLTQPFVSRVLRR